MQDKRSVHTREVGTYLSAGLLLDVLLRAASPHRRSAVSWLGGAGSTRSLSTRSDGTTPVPTALGPSPGRRAAADGAPEHRGAAGGPHAPARCTPVPGTPGLLPSVLPRWVPQTRRRLQLPLCPHFSLCPPRITHQIPTPFRGWECHRQQRT